jgi:hypothetical protein
MESFRERESHVVIQQLNAPSDPELTLVRVTYRRSSRRRTQERKGDEGRER